jgi:tetratricopeptide (TPR) repeat protein
LLFIAWPLRVIAWLLRACVVLFCAIALTACRRSPAPNAHPIPRGSLTFNKDIAPILFEHCATCHRPVDASDSPASRTDPACFAGAPFSLLEYGDVRTHARQVADATMRRVMPPWLPERGDGEFVNERRLRDDQIAMIERWVEEGAIEGQEADRPPIPTWPEGWQLGRPDLVLTMPQPYTLQAVGTDVFRNFVIPVPASSTRYVRAIEFHAGNPRSLHHASVGVDRFRVSRKLDRSDPGPGFAAMPDDQVQNVFGWSPGKVPFLEPADRAWVLEKGSDLVVQLHMLPTGKPELIQPTLGLFLSSAPPAHEPLQIKLESKAIDIPAGRADYAIDDSYLLPADIEILSIYPHAHYLAKEMQGVATLPDGTMRHLISIKAWDFRWQDQYRYRTPMFLPKGTTLAMHFTYDNSDGNARNPHHPPERVKWGPQSSNEMGALWLEILPRRPEDAGVLLREFERRALRADIDGAETQVATSPADAVAHNFLATKYLQAGRVPDAIGQLEQALRLKPDDAEAHSNLGTALQLQGRLPEAVQHAREAVRLEPHDDRVHFNLGNAMNATGRVDEAIREFGRAVQINPENADAHFNLAMLLGPRNRIDEAIAHLRRALDINPQNAEAHRNLAVALGFKGRVDDAIAEAREAVRLRPDSAEAEQQLALLLKARISNPR